MMFPITFIKLSLTEKVKQEKVTPACKPLVTGQCQNGHLTERKHMKK